MKTIKTADCVSAYNILKDSSLGKMSGADKINVIKTIKSIKGVAEDFIAFRTDASERLRGDNHDEMTAKATKWQTDGDDALTYDEKVAVNGYFNKYGEELKQCVDEELNREHEVDVRTIAEDAFCLLLEANDNLSAEQALSLHDMLVSEETEK